MRRRSVREFRRGYGSIGLGGGDWFPREAKAADRYWPSVFDGPRFERTIDGALLADHTWNGGSVVTVIPSVPVRVVRGRRA